ncbi:NAD(P)-binding protein [Dehalobacter sp. DCM]|uniref:NAD(P)-binding protein n=1 Tax=Dehalobacter sp. DCM TaxID=2907827 RepID=UPI0030819DB3|nr:NAD(P)-binding protein [Dehalobacter sp. DCM]
MSNFDTETIIVGGGAAGMSCAYGLRKENSAYTLICDRMGGRIMYDPKLDMNYGAVFYFGNYHHMLGSGILTPGPDVLPSLRQGCCHPDDHTQFAALSAHTLGHAGSLLKFQRYMKKKFLPHYEKFKKECETREVASVLKDDPFMSDLFYKTADKMIAEVGFQKIADDLVSQFAHGCTGTPIKKLSALDYLNCVQALVMDLKRFRFEADRITRELSEKNGKVVFDMVNTVEKIEGGWRVSTANGNSFTAKYLVMATPADVTRDLLGTVKEVEPLKIRNASVLHAYLIKGEMKARYRKHIVHIFNDAIPIIFTARKRPGIYEIFTEIPFEKHFDTYFDGWEVLGHKYFEHALFTNPNLVLPQNLAPGLIMAGDHNGLGMEPAAISGVYAANKILGKTLD